MFLRSGDGENRTGDYEPAFFIIRINSDDPIGDGISGRLLGTFIHEYIHFLQDLLLPYCMRENLVVLSKFFDQRNKFISLGEIRLPDNDIIEGEFLTKLQTEFTWGGNGFVESVSTVTAIKCLNQYIAKHGFRLFKYTVDFDSSADYHFGARDLLEYIAYKIESKHFPNDLVLPDLPYKALDFIIDHHELSFLSETKRVALAEYCLFNDNPVHRLAVVIDDYKRGLSINRWHGDDDDFIKFLENLTWIAAGRPFETIDQKLDRRLNELLELLAERFPEVSFQTINNWLTQTIQYVRTNLAGVGLFAKLYQMETGEFKMAFSSIINEIGIPLIINRNDEFGTSLGNEETKNEFIQLLLAYEFSDYLKRSDQTCPMYSNCERDRPEIMEEDVCMNAPFRKASRDDLCPFGAFIKAHQLDTINWYVNGTLIPSQGSDWP